jgi:hypothetical protein
MAFLLLCMCVKCYLSPVRKVLLRISANRPLEREFEYEWHEVVGGLK